MFEKTRDKCKAIRNRLYPKEQWPGVIHERRVLNAGSPEKVYVELGCGRDARSLKRVAPHYSLSIGIDFEIAGAADPNRRYRVAVADARYIPLTDNSVDVIGTVDVVEHLADPTAVIRECRRVLRPGGELILKTVNLWFPPILLARLLPHRLRQVINHITTGTVSNDTFPTYYRANTRRALEKVAQAAGLTLVEVRHVSHHPIYLMFSVVVYRLGVFVEQIIRRRDSLRGLRHYIQAVFEKR